MNAIKDHIEWVEGTVKGVANRPRFPTFLACWVCGGIKGALHGGVQVDDPVLAHQLALVQHGYYIAKWEGGNTINRELFPVVCTCTCRHAGTREESIGRCLARWTCPTCGAARTVDSSD